MNRESKLFGKISFLMFIIGLLLFIIAISLFATGEKMPYGTVQLYGWLAWGCSFLASIISFSRKEPGKLKIILYIGGLIFGIIITICLLIWSFHFV